MKHCNSVYKIMSETHKNKAFSPKLPLKQVNHWGYHQQVSVASWAKHVCSTHLKILSFYRIWHKHVAIFRSLAMTAKDKKNICKKMKVVKKIRDMKNSENSKYEKDNWLTSNKENNLHRKWHF